MYIAEALKFVVLLTMIRQFTSNGCASLLQTAQPVSIRMEQSSHSVVKIIPHSLRATHTT